MSTSVCEGGSPWKCSPAEVTAALYLSDRGLLPIGDPGVNVVALYTSLLKGKITAEEVAEQYQVNGHLPEDSIAYRPIR